jgi:hypothetical protein
MPMWRCPHCGTPQAETARCWVCRRSSTSCATCRHYRRSVAAQLGYCGLDRARQPLTGDEIRACWEAWPTEALAATAVPLTIVAARTDAERKPPLEFVEVDGVSEPVEEDAAEVAPVARPIAPATEPGWSLWGDLDR